MSHRTWCCMYVTGTFEEDDDDEEDTNVGRMTQDVEGEEEDGDEKVTYLTLVYAYP